MRRAVAVTAVLLAAAGAAGPAVAMTGHDHMAIREIH